MTNYALIAADGFTVAGVSLGEPFADLHGLTEVETESRPYPGQIYTSDTKTFADPAPPPVNLSAYAIGAQAALLVTGQTFNVAVSGAAPVMVLCDGTNDTRADLALLALFGQDNPAGTKTWIDNSGKTMVLTGAQLVTLATLAGNWISDTYPVLATLLAGIAAGTVTTTGAIDAAFAAVTA